MRRLVEDTIQKQVEAAHSLKEALQKAWSEHCAGLCLESFDPLGEAIRDTLDEQLQAMTSLRDGPVNSFTAAEYPIQSAPALEAGIAELRAFKEHVLRDWPWSDRPLPKVNRKMVEDSRAAIGRK